MNPQDPVSPEQQRLELRLKMQQQRQRMLEVLTTKTKAYPRSMTMRVLTQQPDLVLRLATDVALLVVGPRLMRSVSRGLLLARLLRLANKRGN